MPHIEISVSRYPIKLGQFLKLANIVQDGLEAKAFILNGEITVNGDPEIRRGRQLYRGDKVVCADTCYICN